MAFGITPTGFERKRYIDILADMQSRARTNFGDTIITDTNKPFGKFLDIHAWQIAELWEMLEEVYNSISVDTAEGAALDRLIKYKDLERRVLTAATGTIRVNGTSGTFVGANFIVGKEDGTTYSTTQDGTINGSGYILVPITCNFQGSRGNAEIGEINTIITPLFGVTSVTNESVIANGLDDEKDSDLRERYYSTAGSISNTETIRIAVSAVEGVVSAFIIENATMDEVDGIPPKSFEVYVYGGDDAKIGQAIFNSKAAGIKAFGETEVEVQDVNGNPYTIGFTRPTIVQVIVQINISVNQFFNIASVDELKDKVVQYIGGSTADGTQYNGLGVNANVIRSYINSLAWQITGVVDADTLIAKDGETLGTSNITITRTEISRALLENIDVEVTVL